MLRDRPAKALAAPAKTLARLMGVVMLIGVVIAPILLAVAGCGTKNDAKFPEKIADPPPLQSLQPQSAGAPAPMPEP